jgi:uncharacterized protein (TIGR03437 family)
VRPGVPEEIAVSTATGVWKSADAGLTWASLNGGLPQLPVRRIVSLPKETSGLRVAMMAPTTMTPAVFEWAPGEKSAWQAVPGNLALEQATRAALSREFGVTVTALGYSGDVVYAGAGDGRIYVSLDRGATWLPPVQNPGATVESFSLDVREPRRAVVSLRRRETGPVVLRTTNGGLIWDDVSSNLGLAAVYGVAADFESGAVYAATEAGIYWTSTDLTAMGPATAWKKMASPVADAPVFDVKLDALGQTLYAAVYGYGVYAETSPHRMRDWKIVSAADWTARAGALVQVLVSGLGRVTPTWPAGMAAPMGESAPAVVAQVKAYLDGSAVEVVRATLAPGYIGYYLVEVRLPDVVNSGASELFLETGNSLSNKVRLYIEP